MADKSGAALSPARRALLAAQDHLLCLVCHHIAFDGWSAGILAKELAPFYRAFREGRRPWPLAELPIEYADHAHSQRDATEGRVKTSPRKSNTGARNRAPCLK